MMFGFLNKITNRIQGTFECASKDKSNQNIKLKNLPIQTQDKSAQNSTDI
jgi:hypothetical protein